VFLVSTSYSAGTLDDNLNGNHDHETEFENGSHQLPDLNIPIIGNPFDSNYFEDQGPESNMFDDINTSNTFQTTLEPMNDKHVRESIPLLERDVPQDVWQDLLQERDDEHQMNLDPTSLEKSISEFESELGSSSGTKEIELNQENFQEKTYSFLDKLKDMMHKIKSNSLTTKLLQIINNYYALVSYGGEQIYFERFAISVKNYIKNDGSNQIKQGIELIKKNVNLPENSKIKNRLLSVEKDLETSLKYYDDIFNIVSQLNEMIENGDLTSDLDLIRSNITSISDFIKNQSVDEIMRKSAKKIFEIYGVLRKSGKINEKMKRMKRRI